MELLSTQALERVSVDPADPSKLLLELLDPEGDPTGSEGSHAAKAVINAFVQSVNASASCAGDEHSTAFRSPPSSRLTQTAG